jgi:hypothetical protein
LHNQACTTSTLTPSLCLLLLDINQVEAAFEQPNEEEFLWRAAATKTVLNGTAALTGREF